MCAFKQSAHCKVVLKQSIRCCMLATVAILLVACGAPERERLRSATLIITNGVVIDGTGAEPIADGLVAVRGNRIIAVGQSSDFEIPGKAVVIDAAGGTILPGIINSHSHNATTAATRRILFLMDGVTAVCDMMTSLPRMHYLEQEESNSRLTARGFNAGPIITAPGGYPGVIFGTPNSYEIQGDDEAELAVRDLHAEGVDYIKVALEPGIFGEPWPVLNLQELRTIVETAHEHDLLVRAHVNNAKLDLALDGGVDVIEHVPMPSFSYDDLAPLFDDAGVFHMPFELETQLLRMIDQGIVLVPTLDVIIEDAIEGEDTEPEAAVVNQAVLGVVRFFHDSGGIIALGNDYGNSGVQPGIPLGEMEHLQTAGLSPMEVLEAATRQAAYVCGHGDELGTLEAGKLADLIVVDGNPLDDLNALDAVLYIVKDGELVLSPQQEGE